MSIFDIFEEQRELTDEEMQAYKDMLRRKENDMGAIIVDEAGYKEYQRKTDEALETVERLKQRWENLFNAMGELLEEALTKSKEYSNPFSPANYEYWMGKASAMRELMDRYNEICESEVSNDSNT